MKFMEVLIPKYGHNMVIIDVDLSSFRMQNEGVTEPPQKGHFEEPAYCLNGGFPIRKL